MMIIMVIENQACRLDSKSKVSQKRFYSFSRRVKRFSNNMYAYPSDSGTHSQDLA